MNLEFPKVDLTKVTDAMEDVNTSLRKLAEEIQKRKDDAMAMAFTRHICNLLSENGVVVEVTEIEQTRNAENRFEAEYGFAFTGLDFSEHDKKVADGKDVQIADLKIENKELDKMRKAWMEIAIKHSEENKALKKQIEDLEAIIADGKKPDISISENGVSVGCECGGYHLLKQRVSQLEEQHNTERTRIRVLLREIYGIIN